MPIISRLECVGWSLTEPVLETTVVCPGCKKSKEYQMTLEQLKKIVDDHKIHRDVEGKVIWVEGTTRLLKCPACGYSTVIKVAVHRSGVSSIANPEIEFEEGWWISG